MNTAKNVKPYVTHMTDRQFDTMDWITTRSDDGWMRDAIAADDARIIAHLDAELAAAAKVIADKADAQAAEHIAITFATSRWMVSPATLVGINKALWQVAPGLKMGAMKERNAAAVLGSYFTPSVVLDLLSE